MADDESAFGTADATAPVSRADFERALRHLNMSDISLRDALLQLAARVVALTDELTRRVDRVEPEPAPPNTPAPVPTMTVEDAVGAQLGETLMNVRASDVTQSGRVSLDLGDDKYATPSAGPNCAELLQLCHARCCTLTFALSTRDLDEGVIAWDYGQPYLIRQRESDGYCVHNGPTTHFCTVHDYRPRVCRSYDCREDPRIWVDYENRVVAEPAKDADIDAETPSFDLVARMQARSRAVVVEQRAITETFAERGPRVGPPPPRKPS